MTRRMILRSIAIVTLAGSAALLAPAPVAAQAQNTDARLQDTRDELARIRRERADLEKRMKELQSSAHSLTDELQNLNRQHDATTRALRSLDRQLLTMTQSIQETSASLVMAEDEVVAKRAILRNRLVEIYKRGPTYDIEALLAAESFASLVARYKYLHELAVRDRALVKRVEELRQTIQNRRSKLVTLHTELRGNRQEKATEEKQLSTLEARRKKSLSQVQADSRKAQARLRELARAEARVNSIIANLEAARRKGGAAASATAKAPSSIRTSDYGSLPWPVEGSILYNFGRISHPGGLTTRSDGIGIAAPLGTPVKAVANGEVRAAEPIGLYGRTVIIDHGGGDYSVYASLATIGVKVGSKVTKGQVIGTVGAADPEQPPHLQFQIRHNGPAIDPTTWLRNAK